MNMTVSPLWQDGGFASTPSPVATAEWRHDARKDRGNLQLAWQLQMLRSPMQQSRKGLSWYRKQSLRWERYHLGRRAASAAATREEAASVVSTATDAGTRGVCQSSESGSNTAETRSLSSNKLCVIHGAHRTMVSAASGAAMAVVVEVVTRVARRVARVAKTEEESGARESN